MEKLQNKVNELFSAQKIRLFIGYREGVGKQGVPAFIDNPSKINTLIFEVDYLQERCKNNLVSYLHKPEVKTFGKIGIVANYAGLRTLLQLTAENQLKDIELITLTVSFEGEVIELNNMEEIEGYISKHRPVADEKDAKRIEEIEHLSREERWKYWTDEFLDCIRCYACRAVCPMCYCSRCIIECNQPQWIPISSRFQGNFEWHIVRAMHLAGRCIECRECSRVCPVGIPVHLLTVKLNKDIAENFGSIPGIKITLDYALNTFKVADKASFIK